MTKHLERRLFAQGFLMILMALLVGSFSQFLPNKRMGLATHLEGLLFGLLLIQLGILWPRFSLPGWGRSLLFWLPILGAYCSFFVHLFAAIFPSGEYWMPIAASGKTGSAMEEWIVSAGIILIGVAMLPAVALALWGMLREEERGNSR